jgi:hypothetical protein
MTDKLSVRMRWARNHDGTGCLAQDFAAEVSALEAERDALVATLAELADLMDDTRDGEYTPDSFTTQPARALLAKYEAVTGRTVEDAT